jgi:hypothetical protein
LCVRRDELARRIMCGNFALVLKYDTLPSKRVCNKLVTTLQASKKASASRRARTQNSNKSCFGVRMCTGGGNNRQAGCEARNAQPKNAKWLTNWRTSSAFWRTSAPRCVRARTAAATNRCRAAVCLAGALHCFLFATRFGGNSTGVTHP